MGIINFTVSAYNGSAIWEKKGKPPRHFKKKKTLSVFLPLSTFIFFCYFPSFFFFKTRAY